MRSLLIGVVWVLVMTTSPGAQAAPILYIGDSHTACLWCYGQQLGIDGALYGALGGTTSEDWRQGGLWYEARELSAIGNVGVLVIALGTNDASEGRSPADYAANLASTIAGVGADWTILLEPPTLLAPPEGVESRLSDYRGEVGALIAANPYVVAGPGLATLWAPTWTFRADGVHRTVAAHTLLADALRPILASVPEPGSGVLAALGLGWLVRHRRRRTQRKRWTSTADPSPYGRSVFEPINCRCTIVWVEGPTAWRELYDPTVLIERNTAGDWAREYKP